MSALELSPMRTTLEVVDHPQPPTPIRTDNSTADAIMNETIKQKQSKAMDKRFYWLRDRVEQGEFRVFLAPGNDNLANYCTIYHSLRADTLKRCIDYGDQTCGRNRTHYSSLIKTR